MTTNPTPNQVFVANAVPSGGFFAKIYRPQAAGAGFDELGTYRVLTFTPNREATITDRPDVDGGDNGWTMIAGKIEGGITIQLPVDASPTLQPGDAFVTSVIFRTSAGAAVQQMIVMSALSTNMDTGPRGQTGNARVDKQATSGGTGYDNLDAMVEYGV